MQPRYRRRTVLCRRPVNDKNKPTLGRYAAAQGEQVRRHSGTAGLTQRRRVSHILIGWRDWAATGSRAIPYCGCLYAAERLTHLRAIEDVYVGADEFNFRAS